MNILEYVSLKTTGDVFGLYRKYINTKFKKNAYLGMALGIEINFIAMAMIEREIGLPAEIMLIEMENSFKNKLNHICSQEKYVKEFEDKYKMYDDVKEHIYNIYSERNMYPVIDKRFTEINNMRRFIVKGNNGLNRLFTDAYLFILQLFDNSMGNRVINNFGEPVYFVDNINIGKYPIGLYCYNNYFLLLRVRTSTSVGISSRTRVKVSTTLSKDLQKRYNRQFYKVVNTDDMIRMDRINAYKSFIVDRLF